MGYEVPPWIEWRDEGVLVASVRIVDAVGATIVASHAAGVVTLTMSAPGLGSTPSTQAFGDAAAGGSASTASKNDHKHAMMADPVTAHVAADDPHTGYQKESEKGAASGYPGLTAGQLVTENPANATATPTASKIVISDAGGKVDAWVSACSTTVPGLAEAAIASEVNTGTDSARAVTPLALATSNLGIRGLGKQLVADDTALVTGNGKGYIVIPAWMNGWNLVAVTYSVAVVSSSGTPTMMIRNVTQAADMLSVSATIDADEFSSETAATAPDIDENNDDVATGDVIAFDKDVAGTGEKGDTVICWFQKT